LFLGAVLSSCSSSQHASESTADISAKDAGQDAGAICGMPAQVCAPPIPSFANDLTPLFDAKCNTCHDGMPGSPWPLTNYDDVSAWAVTVLSDIVACTMPPADAGAPELTEAERATLIDWLVCGAPNN
jgi:hypothetical protein